jgi:cold shock CspA family protein
MRGKVKWFSREKGYGFITDEQARDHYYSVRDVRGAELPASGDQVQFQSQDTSRGLRASAIQLIARSESDSGCDDRVKCGHCGKKMVPRILSYQGQVERSIFPFCGESHRDFLAPATSLLRWIVIGGFALFVLVACLGS